MRSYRPFLYYRLFFVFQILGKATCNNCMCECYFYNALCAYPLQSALLGYPIQLHRVQWVTLMTRPARPGVLALAQVSLFLLAKLS